HFSEFIACQQVGNVTLHQHDKKGPFSRINGTKSKYLDQRDCCVIGGFVSGFFCYFPEFN
ncbi:MAG: hypothetical protein ABGX71_03730, partial [Methyloprofundus sp.]